MLTVKLRHTLAALLVGSLVVVAGCDNPYNTQNQSTSQESSKVTVTKETSSNVAQVRLTIYVPKEDGSGVTKKIIQVEPAKKTLKTALITVLQEDGAMKYPVFAKGTDIKDVKIVDGIATINFNKQFLEGANQDLTAKVRLMALEKTALDFEGVKKVQYAVDGKVLRTYGAIDVQ